MSLEKWVRIEKVFLEEELRCHKAGAKVMSPSGDDMTTDIIKKLEARIEGASIVLRDVEEQRRLAQERRQIEGGS